MEKLNKEHLLQDFKLYGNLKGAQTELLRRLSRPEKLEEEVERLKLTAVCVYCGKVMVADKIENKMDVIIEHMSNCEKHPLPKALVAVEDMACCGNCKHWHEQPFYCHNEAFGYCEKYECDNMTREEREK